MFIADTLGRAYAKETDTSCFERDIEVVNMVRYLPKTEPRLNDIQLYTSKDEAMQVLETRCFADGRTSARTLRRWQGRTLISEMNWSFRMEFYFAENAP